MEKSGSVRGHLYNMYFRFFEGMGNVNDLLLFILKILEFVGFLGIP
jgi:hypothetical protein